MRTRKQLLDLAAYPCFPTHHGRYQPKPLTQKGDCVNKEGKETQDLKSINHLAVLSHTLCSAVVQWKIKMNRSEEGGVSVKYPNAQEQSITFGPENSAKGEAVTQRVREGN